MPNNDTRGFIGSFRWNEPIDNGERFSLID